jgi:hypothetical protein
MKLIGRLICAVKGHKRGKWVDQGIEWKKYRCPRCHATWSRKVKGENKGHPTDGSPRYPKSASEIAAEAETCRIYREVTVRDDIH